jgi:hypothetical protein
VHILELELIFSLIFRFVDNLLSFIGESSLDWSKRAGGVKLHTVNLSADRDAATPEFRL